MQQTKLCLGTIAALGIPDEEQVVLFKEMGFDGFFVNWTKEINVKKIKEVANSCGMIFQSIHAPFYQIADVLWQGGVEAEAAIETLITCAKDCAENEIPIMVCHAFIGFDRDDVSPSQKGIENYRRVVEAAKELGVKIAFENTEGEEYLAVLMDAFKDYENVGFCWDTGHEICYNHSKDMMALYGDRLLCTHLEDNLGISDYNGKIFWTDDLHLLPFDGAADWQGIVHRLNRYNYNGELTFELNKTSKPNRHENDGYTKMTNEEYICEVFKRACRVAMLKLRDKGVI